MLIKIGPLLYTLLQLYNLAFDNTKCIVIVLQHITDIAQSQAFVYRDCPVCV